MIRKLTEFHPESLLGRLVRLPLRLIPPTRVVSVVGGINKGAAWICGSSIHGCWLGTYEPEMQRLMEKIVRPGMRIWDIGANAGFYTLAFSRLVGGAGRVYAFEPLAGNAKNLLAHVRLNELRNVTVVQTALSAATGLAGFHVAPSNSMGHVAAAENSYLVPTVTVDGFLAERPEARPDLIKVDVEGAESSLLAGGLQFLTHAAPEIVLAVHGPEQGRICADLLASLGYSLFHPDGAPVAGGLTGSEQIHARKIFNS